MDLGTVTATAVTDCWWVRGAVSGRRETQASGLASQTGMWEREGGSTTQSLRVWVVDSDCLCPDPSSIIPELLE